MNKKEPTETVLKIHPKSINEIYRIALELNQKLVDAIITEMKKQNAEFTLKFIDDLQEKKRKSERLYNLKELSKVMKIPYQTMKGYTLPYRTIGGNPRKMYNLNEVNEYLKR